MEFYTGNFDIAIFVVTILGALYLIYHHTFRVILKDKEKDEPQLSRKQYYEKQIRGVSLMGSLIIFVIFILMIGPIRKDNEHIEKNDEINFSAPVPEEKPIPEKNLRDHEFEDHDTMTLEELRERNKKVYRDHFKEHERILSEDRSKNNQANDDKSNSKGGDTEK